VSLDCDTDVVYNIIQFYIAEGGGRNTQDKPHHSGLFFYVTSVMLWVLLATLPDGFAGFS